MIKVNFQDLIRFAKLEQKVATAVNEEIKEAVVATTIETHHLVVQKQPVFKGALRNATQFKAPIVRGRGFIKTISGEIFMVGNAGLYGNVQDLGRTPGSKLPPHDAIRRWVTLKLSRGQLRMNSQQNAGSEQHQLDPRRNRRRAIDQATFLIRRKISEMPAVRNDGTKKGHEFFGQAEAGALASLNRRLEKIAEDFEQGLAR